MGACAKVNFRQDRTRAALKGCVNKVVTITFVFKRDK